MKTLRAHLWGAYEKLAMCLGLGGLAVVCLTWLPFAMVFDPLLPPRIGQRVGRHAICLGFRIYLAFLRVCCACRFDFAGLEGLRREGPMVLVANHPSLLDAVLVLSCLPNAVCVMKASLLDNILFGSAARMARYIRNDPPWAMLQNARRELADGAQLVIFPEGGRTCSIPLDRCMPTAGLIASRARVPVQTLLIDFSTPYLGKAWPLFRPPTLPLSCRIRLGRRFSPPTGDIAGFTAELETYLRAELDAATWPTARA